MAFQQGGINGGPGGVGDHHAPQGTEYTLQGGFARAAGWKDTHSLEHCWV